MNQINQSISHYKHLVAVALAITELCIIIDKQK